MSAKTQEVSHHTSLAILHALASVIPAQCKVELAPDHKDAIVHLAHGTPDATGSIADVKITEVPMSLLNDAYIGTVKLWPTMKEVKDTVIAQLRADAEQGKVKAREEKEASRRAEIEARKAQREADRKARLEQQEKDRAERQAKAEAARKEREEAKAKAKAEKDAAKAKAAADKAKAEEAKRAADTAKATKAATKLDAKGQLPSGKTAGAKAVAAVKGSMRKSA